MFIVLLVFLLGFSVITIPTVFWWGLAVIPLIVIFGLICGHLLGGSELENRSSIATGTIARNAGLALFLLAANGTGQAIPTMIAYMVGGSLTALPYNVWAYNVWVKRQQQGIAVLGGEWGASEDCKVNRADH
jgi:BASS family bile acid:Na+ symporter